MKVQVRFHSELFHARSGSEKSLRLQGAALARWLSQKLHEAGLTVVHVEPGECGCLSITLDAGFPLCIGCSHAESGGGDWHCVIEGGPGFFRNLFHPLDPAPEICRLQEALGRILGSEPHITGITWGPDELRP